eukprot:gnl/MRDRNA2_/MRDRNA2_201937_c0_seq1.p1 gnl/MRDRNA2_/MRDRNA2_201937_c0~~gnl/MRDRNA2_/MRDRNA2_201937_c0_seq1.p1  ORF type:complete len:543 (-),score=83.11 gnl/MRDRNA2_/MRDRNA2_201937_c0_seq1:76-1704(-)
MTQRKPCQETRKSCSPERTPTGSNSSPNLVPPKKSTSHVSMKSDGTGSRKGSTKRKTKPVPPKTKTGASELQSPSSDSLSNSVNGELKNERAPSMESLVSVTESVTEGPEKELSEQVGNSNQDSAEKVEEVQIQMDHTTSTTNTLLPEVPVTKSITAPLNVKRHNSQQVVIRHARSSDCTNASIQVPVQYQGTSSEQSCQTDVKKQGFFAKTLSWKTPKSTASFRHANYEHRTGLDQVVRVGDIMRILRKVVDHVILVVGVPMLRSRIESSDGTVVDVWFVPTLEAATNLEHCEVTEMAMVIDVVDDNKIKVIDRTDPADTTSWEPTAVFLSPLSSTDIDQEEFARCVDEVVCHKQVWSKATAVKAGTRSARIDSNEYPDDGSKTSLVRELTQYWESAPICTTMPIRVWQMYFVNANEGNPLEAAENILTIIPAKCDRCLPHELWEILVDTEVWVEMRQTSFHTTALRSSVSSKLLKSGGSNLSSLMSHISSLATTSSVPKSSPTMAGLSDITIISVHSLKHDRKQNKRVCGCFPRRRRSKS